MLFFKKKLLLLPLQMVGCELHRWNFAPFDKLRGTRAQKEPRCHGISMDGFFKEFKEQSLFSKVNHLTFLSFYLQRVFK